MLRRVPCLALVLFATAATAQTLVPSRFDPTLTPDEQRAWVYAWVARADSLGRAREFSAAVELYDRLDERVLAAGKPRIFDSLQQSRMRLLLEPRPQEVVRLAQAMVKRARASTDQRLLCDGLYYLARGYDNLGRDPRAIGAYEELVETATAIGDSINIAKGEGFLARRYRHSGDLESATAHLRRSTEVFRAIGRERTAVGNLILQGLIAVEDGRRDDGLAAWREGARRSKDFKNPSTYTNCLNNIAVLESQFGDPSVAQACWRAARDRALARGRVRDAIRPTMSLAESLADFGRFETASALLDSTITSAHAAGYSILEGELLRTRGAVALKRSRPHEAVGYFRRANALLFARGDAMSRLSISRIYAHALADVDSVDSALQIIEERCLPILDEVPESYALDARCSHAAILFASGRFEDALEAGLDAMNMARNINADKQLLRLSSQLHQVYLAMGSPDSALAALENGRLVFERLRSMPEDAEWREQRNELGYAIFPALAELMLSQRGAQPEEIYPLLSGYKSRTLLERLAPPGTEWGEEPPRLDVSELQSRLQDDEVLLDVYLGQERSFVFVISKQACDLYRWSGEAEIDELLARYFDLLATPPENQNAAFSQQAARSIFDKLFSEELVADLREQRILFCPDGATTRLPLSAVFDAAGVMVRSIARVPSAHVLRALRERDERPPTDPRVLALVGQSDRLPLPGGERELASIQRRFNGVQSRALSTDLSEWSPAALLHIAAHARTNDQDPWRSTIRIDGSDRSARGNDTIDSPAQIRASDIALTELETNLVVLSGCETMGVERFRGAGVLGLSSAFLSAGAQQVVATLWPVDDASTAEFMERFYDAIQAGMLPVDALLDAQRQTREASATQHPFYWAGFILVGNPATALRLDARPEAIKSWPWAIGGLTLTAIWFAARRRSSRNRSIGIGTSADS